MKRVILFLILFGWTVPSHAQGELVPWVQEGFQNANGSGPLANGFVCTYAAGTTTPLSTYSDYTLTTANQNPIRLNSAGRPSYMSSEVAIFLGVASYKFITYAAGTGNTCNGTTVGALVKSVDNVFNLAQLHTLVFATKLDDKVCHASQYTGATEDAKITACIAVLPTTGGTVDARGLEGSQTWAACWGTGVTKKVTVILGAGTHVVAVNCTLPYNVTLEMPDGAILSPSTSITLTLTSKPIGTDTQHFTGAGSVKLPETWLTWHGALCDWNGSTGTNDAVAIQAAADSVSPLNGGTIANAGIVHGPGLYRPCKISTTLNLTNSRTGTTPIRDGLRMLDVNLVGETGAGWAIVETTGSQFLELTGMLQSGAASKSTSGLYQGVSTALTQTQNQRISLRIVMHDDATANSNAGTIGLFNYGSEETTYVGLYTSANIPAYLTGLSTGAGVYTYTHSYQTLSATHSCGLNTFSGETFMVSMNLRSYPLITENVNSTNIQNVYLANTGSGGAIDVAWLQLGAFDGGEISGTQEYMSTFVQVNGTVKNLKARITFGTLNTAAATRIKLTRGGEGIIVGSDITMQDTVYPNRALMNNPASAANDVVSCYIRNTTFRVEADKQYLLITENVKWNPNTGNVTIEGLSSSTPTVITTNRPWRYFIGNHEDTIWIPPTNVYVSGGIAEAEVVRFTAPTVFGTTANGLSGTVRLTGYIGVNSGGTAASWSASHVDAVANIAIGPTGAITLSAATGDQFAVVGAGATAVLPTVVNTAIGGLDITTWVMKQTAVSTTGVQLIITPTKGGADSVTLQFTGQATLTWFGNESRAPRLQLP